MTTTVTTPVAALWAAAYFYGGRVGARYPWHTARLNRSTAAALSRIARREQP